MAIVPVGTVTGSSSTYYADYCWISTSAGRVVYRGCYYAYASGGVSYAYADIGSRLAFRGNIVKAQSVAAYKALDEAA